MKTIKELCKMMAIGDNLPHNWQFRKSYNAKNIRKVFYVKFLRMLSVIQQGGELPRGWDKGLSLEEKKSIYDARGYGTLETHNNIRAKINSRRRIKKNYKSVSKNVCKTIKKSNGSSLENMRQLRALGFVA